MSNNECSESQSAGYNVSVTLTGAAIEVLGQLFIMGPTYDGDVASKSGRDELYGLKLIGRCEGYQSVSHRHRDTNGFGEPTGSQETEPVPR